MALTYDYDEQSETWPFFVLTILLMIIVPVTISHIYHLFAKSDGEAEDGNDVGSFESLSDKYTSQEIKQFRKKFDRGNNKGNILSRRNILLMIGWAFVAFLIHRINTNDAIQDSVSSLFDPYDILGISSSASEREIKSAYRKLSVKFHPDKLAKELTEQERTTMEEAYVQITKAYEALTDELTRQNFLKYGHPDGPQSTSHGIALPSFLIDSTSSPILVAIYIGSFVLLLPYVVSKWWSKTRSYTKKGIHVKSASYFVDRLVNYKPSEIVTVDLMLKWLSYAEEFKQFFPDMKPEDFEKLLHDYINRRDSGSKKLNMAKYRIVAKCHSLIHGLVDIACGFRNLEVATVALDTFKCIVQAVPKSPYSQIEQLPNVDMEVFKNGMTDKIQTVGKLFKYDDEKIGKILGIKDNDQLKETLQVAANIPQLHVLRADFVVPGETVVTPLSTPHISIKVLLRSAKHKLIPTEKFPAEMLEEPEDFEHMRDPFASMAKQPLVPYSFAPYFPTKRRNTWCCLVALQKDNKIAQTAMNIERLSFKNLSKHFDKRTVKDLESGNFNPSDWEIGTIKIPLGQQAPKETGNVFFRIVIKSTDYFGSDLDITMKMHVQDPPKVEEAEDLDIYDASDESELEDSDEEDESDSDYTDIDTDTEVEEDATDN
ncbi:hypothetical protein KAFR_0H02310 [Kazachstania africana CBS 2517]|uniref:J domain-containing protein n=1 Tax=Kazachstania africana (strain ATCC 22294 / BCRC 22015 / CBS 2517 / CECT 1963 / NBRC 1671 / NRRL Y-8276) TaxID=1071382 RepID=H2AZ84_KAZAF|nr:hypothetical protein KAFR_0H02310 [Kazachstania africana CBS 2517]CCF59640.1 hypothetical protein KAFR_0H02310 [Kazachstania africana CBS 2517]